MAEIDRDEEARVLRKVSRRFLWFLFILLIINFVDRTNIGFAALTMNRDLHLTASVFGLAVSVFSVGYMLCEIPSNLMLARFGARTWLARIVVTWGIIACACALVEGAASLVTMRALLGLAEAGYIPGVLLYTTYWFPQYHRARAQVTFLIAQPVANVVGPLLSGFVLGLNGTLGIAGWRWLFLLEGLPAIMFGAIAYFYLTDRPTQATWLTAGEKATLAGLLERDGARHERASPLAQRSLWRQIVSRNVLLLAFCLFMMIANFNALAIWLPQIVRGMIGPSAPYWQVGMITAIPPLCTLLVIPFWSVRSDHRRERYWHCLGPIMIAAVAWWFAAAVHQPVLQLLGLTIASITSIMAWPIFLTLPAMVLPRAAHPAGIAFVTTIGLGGAVVSPLIVGAIRDLTGGFAGGMAATGIMLAVGAGLMLLVPKSLLAAPDDEDLPAVAAQPTTP